MGSMDLLLHCPHRLPRLCSEWPMLVALGLAWASLAVWWLARRLPADAAFEVRDRPPERDKLGA